MMKMLRGPHTVQGRLGAANVGVLGKVAAGGTKLSHNHALSPRPPPRMYAELSHGAFSERVWASCHPPSGHIWPTPVNSGPNLATFGEHRQMLIKAALSFARLGPN